MYVQVKSYETTSIHLPTTVSSINSLSNLTTNRARHRQRGVHVGEEGRRVGLDLADVEVGASVNAIVVLDAGREGSLEAADGDALLVVADGVGEGEARRAGLTLGRLVDVGGRVGGRLVLAAEVLQLDVVADQVEVGVDAEVVVALGALSRESLLANGHYGRWM